LSAAGFTTTLSDQLTQMLGVVGIALRSVTASHRKATRKQSQNAKRAALNEADIARSRERIRSGTWYDARMGAVAGGSVMAELGVGDEPFLRTDVDSQLTGVSDKDTGHGPEKTSKVSEDENVEAVDALPIVVIRNFAVVAERERVADVLARWAAVLVEDQVRFMPT
jgi:RNA12 protein